MTLVQLAFCSKRPHWQVCPTSRDARDDSGRALGLSWAEPASRLCCTQVWRLERVLSSWGPSSDCQLPAHHLLPTCHGEARLLAPVLGQTLSKFPAKGQGLKGPNSQAASATTTRAIILSPNSMSLSASASAQAFHTSFPCPLNLLPWAWPAPHPAPTPIMGSDIYLPAISLSVLSEKLHSLRYQC